MNGRERYDHLRATIAAAEDHEDDGPRQPQRQQRGDLHIDEEIVMAEIPRGERGEVLRVTFTKATAGDGKRVAWHAIRVWYRDQSGELRPGKQGITIRGRELRPVADALAKACGGRT